ncbi:hypothetical protein [Streptomyces sp. NPDC093544]|jgi:hypothetical protein|uniref:hypothetical protein n=1 Tax=Streptomyces sp. NPDC093544 TaxID=3155200 RepID=UPI0034195B09
MPDSPVPTTSLTSQYSAQVAEDLRRNTKEQDRLSSEIDALQEQLNSLQSDHLILQSLQQTLSQQATSEPKTPRVPDTASVPAQQQAETTSKPTNAKPKSAADKSSRGKSRAGQPTLIDLIRTHLDEQAEPRSAAEITVALGGSHPDRNLKNTVVRTTLENLVAKNRARRLKQGHSVFYVSPGGKSVADTEAAATSG